MDLFFVLSGFLIGSILIAYKDSANFFSTFFARRALRIIPNYYLLLVVYFGLCTGPIFQTDYFISGNNVIPWWSYFVMLNNVYMAALQNMGNTALSVTWSISIEEQFYLLFPFLIYFIGNRWLPFFLLTLIVSASLIRAQFHHWIPPYVLLPSRMDALSFGVLVAYIDQKSGLVLFVQKYYGVLLMLMFVDIAACGGRIFLLGRFGPCQAHTFCVFVCRCSDSLFDPKEQWTRRDFETEIVDLDWFNILFPLFSALPDTRTCSSFFGTTWPRYPRRL